MQNAGKKFRLWGLLLLLIVFSAGVTTYVSANEVQAATAGFKTINGKTYYIKSDGSKQKGWLELNGKKYYFNTKTGVQMKGWLKDSKGNKRYFTSGTGAMVTGWVTDSKGNKRYFNKSTGIMTTKWATISNKKYYFYSSSGIAAKGFLTDSKSVTRYFLKNCSMATGWLTNSSGAKRYFASGTGAMAKGFSTIDGKTYYFYKGSGKMATGWVTSSSGNKYYFDTSTGVMATGTVTISGKKYSFSSKGVLIGEVTSSTQPQTATPTSTRTIKNFLAYALQPVGQTLYIWGGGHGEDATRKGVSPVWKQWYDSQSSSYDYNNYRYQDTKGLDCSGYVGWAAYQITGVYNTTTAAEVGSTMKGKGWGVILNQNYLQKTNYVLRPGDVGYNSGHTWIVLGQCEDMSVVILHSTTNAGVQISGTPTPSGSYSSQAITLAQRYMSKYSGYSKYDYHTSSGNYIKNGNYIRWNSSTLSDPNGYKNMTADQILADLF